MPKMKITNKYYFSVEGETEELYLKWLQDKINNSSEARFKVSFDCKINKNPLKRAKLLVVTSKTDIYHICDYESDEQTHAKEFKDAMDNMKKAKALGKQITYKFGYTNLTFELWIILHKMDCYTPFTHRKQYLTLINKAFNESFESLGDYKLEANFKRILNSLTLNNVISAVERSKDIMQKNINNGYKLQEYKGFKYYKENPSLTIWEVIDKIIKDCRLV